ncbi:MAG: glycosyltransferase family 2 protein [candidate division KSB1 bacterium]|jgi:glycosyltransferase involved in cell wall biosynthesis|nr:glycosyltransferase family 2 protein [candidate division KSB1 bacterium]
MSGKITVTIITKNEETNIERCLKSVAWADEIVVADSGSTDATIEICKRHNCKIIMHEWLGFGPMKRLAVDSAMNHWIFSIDADEEVTDVLRQRIADVMKSPEYNGYRIKRRSFYMGKPINYCGWQRDYQLRLFDRRFGNFNAKQVHESVQMSGEIGRIESPLLHYTYPTLHSHIQRMNRYADLGAQQLKDKGKSASIFSALMRGIVKFIKMYLFNFGILDGRRGFILCYNSAFGVYLKYIRLWELNRS